MALLQPTLRLRSGRAAKRASAKAEATENNPAEPQAESKPQSKPDTPPSIWPERFIGRYFLRMPPSVRVIVYLLIVAVYVHNAMQESILLGQLWIRHADGKEEQAANYVVQTWTPYATNAEGRWALPSGKRLPLGSIEAEILTSDRLSLGTTELCLPLPILGPLLGSPHYRIVFDETSRTLTTRATPRCPSLGTFVGTVFAQERRPVRVAVDNRYLTVREVTLKNTGHVDRPAEVYLRIYVNGLELRPRGFPSREQESTWLLLVDNKPAALNNLTFTLDAQDPKLMIEIWDRDRSVKSFFKDQDDRLAQFSYDVRRGEMGRRVLSDKSGTTMTVELH